MHEMKRSDCNGSSNIRSNVTGSNFPQKTYDNLSHSIIRTEHKLCDRIVWLKNKFATQPCRVQRLSDRNSSRSEYVGHS